MDRPPVDTEMSPSFAPFLLGGAVGLTLGLLIGSVVGSVFARPIGTAVRSLRRRLGADDEPHFEFLAQ
ncbi:MAG: hypothetical protein ACYDAR_15235 [Thermomicrobiales bacterium]